MVVSGVVVSGVVWCGVVWCGVVVVISTPHFYIFRYKSLCRATWPNWKGMMCI